LKKLFDTFVQLGLKVIYGNFHKDWTEHVASENIQLISTSFKVANSDSFGAILGGLITAKCF
jgi:hypothetical protein